MLRRNFDPTQPYQAVIYTRRSSPKQNDRSPAQQEAEIRRVLTNLRYPWRVVKVYTDTETGKYTYRRIEFQRMLMEIKSGMLPEVDLILLDTSERIGRSKSNSSIRDELRQKYGVLLVAANNQFADPTTPQGEVFGAFEDFRATEENRIKAHQVRRGKRDLAQRGYWPGGKPPFGYQLVPVISQKDGVDIVEGRRLEPFAEEAWIVKLLFQQAYDTGHGRTKLTRFLNEHPDIPDEFKPFNGSTTGCWLKQEVYNGELIWGRNTTAIIDDTRRVEPNAEEDVLHVTDFCTPLVTGELWEAVQAVCRTRSAAAKQRRSDAETQSKLIAPLAPGMTLVYLLTGLVRCGKCGASMRPISSGTRSKSGTRYAYYQCPRYVDHNCPNGRSVREQWLREEVVALMKDQLFPEAPSAGANRAVVKEDSLLCSASFRTLQAEVEQEMKRRQGVAGERRPAIQQEIDKLDAQISGWRMSLGNPELETSVRHMLERDLSAAFSTRQELQMALAKDANQSQTTKRLVNPKIVADRLNRLADVLTSDNASLGNLELAMHIDRINCYSDGRVVVRLCRLGALTDVVMLLRDDNLSAFAAADGDRDTGSVEPRRRAKLRIDDWSPNDGNLDAVRQWVADPHRFSDLDDRWFSEIEFQTPGRPLSWAKEHAEAVFRRRQKVKLSYADLAKEFCVTPPTTRAAVLQYLADHPEAKDEVNLPRGGKRPPKFDLAKIGPEVRALWEDGCPKTQLADRFSCSTPTIDKALAWAYEQDGLPLPTRADRKAAKIAEARKLLDSGRSLEEIREALDVSDVTARSYLRHSFAAEGEQMPDLRRRPEPPAEPDA
ncbi:MAG: recombinase family protein [Pirellulaceae bacterium]